MAIYDISKIELPNGDICNLKDNGAERNFVKTIENENIIHIEDAAAMPLKELKINIEPVQDLHGYDRPWPAGGGKNLLPTVLNTIKDINTSGTWNNNSYIFNGITFTISIDQDGNIAGINANGTASADANFYIVSMYKFPEGSYTLNGCPSGGSTTTYRIFATNWGSDTGSGVNVTLDGSTATSIRIQVSNETTVSNMIFKPMVRLSSVSDASFVPYSNLCPITGWAGANIVVSPTQDAQDGTTYSISWQSEAGTVYGGSLDVVNGVLTVDMVSVEIDGSIPSSFGYGSFPYIVLPGGAGTYQSGNAQSVTMLSNIENPTSINGGYVLRFADGIAGVTDKESFGELLTNTHMQIVVPLATPQTIQLSPESLYTIIGENNIWSDTGTSSCTYYINSNLTTEFTEYKKLQIQISDPVADGTATAFISSITQNVNGVITALKANLPTASTSNTGVVQLNTATNSTSTTQAATPSAVKTAYDLALTASNSLENLSTNVIIKDEPGNVLGLQHAGAINSVPDLTLRPMISSVRANRLIFLPASAIIVEKTTDGGTTWVSAGLSDTAKREVFADIQNGVALPLLNSKQNKLCGLRFIITAMVYNVPANTAETDKYTYWNSSYVTDRERYCSLYGLYFWVSTKSDNNGITVKVEAATGANPNNWVTICQPDPTKYTLTGWSGGNFITFPESFFGGYVTQTDRYWNYKITFMSYQQVGQTFNTNVSSAPSIVNIAGYGNSYYYGNDMMKYDHIYHYDVNQNAFFPGKVEANRFTGAGTNITALNASNISSGTLNAARLPSDIQGTVNRLDVLQPKVAQLMQWQFANSKET